MFDEAEALFRKAVKIDQLDKSFPVRTKIEDLDGLVSFFLHRGRRERQDASASHDLHHV